MTSTIPAEPDPTRNPSGAEITARRITNTTLDRPPTNPSMALRTVSIVLVLVRITDTARTNTTRTAGPVKSTAPWMNALEVDAWPRRAAIPTKIGRAHV